MSEDEIAEAEGVVSPANQTISSAMQMINQKSKQADASMQAELSKLRSRGTEVKGKLDKINTKLKSQKEGVSVHAWVEEARGKLEKVDAALSKCQEAEMPFLKGIEVLPKDESDEALAASEKAAQETTSAVTAAKKFISAKLAAAKNFSSKELVESATEQLSPYLKRAEATDQKLQNFKKETAERKMNALMAEAVEAVVEVERKANALVMVGKALATDKLSEATNDAV